MKPGSRALRLAKAMENTTLNSDEILTDRGYMSAVFIQTTIPHRKMDELIYIRRNGDITLTITADQELGMPYGTYPRLILTYLTTEAVRKQSPIIELGDSLSSFMRKLGISPTGGSWGSIPRLKDQMKRLLASNITLKDDRQNRFSVRHLNPVDRANIWWIWEPMSNYDQSDMYSSTIKLQRSFYDELIKRPVVFQMSALKELKQSPLATDIYMWTTYKNSYTNNNTYIKWTKLQMQFGAGYPDTPQGRRDFKKNFLSALKQVAAIYPDAGKLKAEQDRLIFVPGRPHVPKLFIPKSC